MPLPGPFGLPGSPPTWFFPRPAAPPFTLTNNFEGGTPGTTITPANSGGISGDAASAITFNGTGAVVRFSNAVSMLDSVCMECVLGSVAGEAFWQWDHPANPLSTAYFRTYLILPTAPPANIRIVAPQDSGGGARPRVLVTTARQIILTNTAGSTSATMTTPIPTSQLVRVEVLLVGSPTAGQLEARLYLDPSADVASYSDVVAVSGVDTGGAINRTRFGPNGATVANHTSYYDAIGLSAAYWLGPVPGPVAAAIPLPVISTAAVTQASTW